MALRHRLKRRRKSGKEDLLMEKADFIRQQAKKVERRRQAAEAREARAQLSSCGLNCQLDSDSWAIALAEKLRGQDEKN